MERFT
jgi:hypothetical protein